MLDALVIGFAVFVGMVCIGAVAYMVRTALELKRWRAR